MKSLSVVQAIDRVFKALLVDDLGLNRDYLTFQNRLKNEGLPFVLTALPLLGKCFDRALGDGKWDVNAQESFSCSGKNYPLFLSDLFQTVFDDSGLLRQDADPLSVRKIRQICFLAYKMDAPYDDEKVEAVKDNFYRNELEISKITDDLDLNDPLIRMANAITKGIFPNVNRLYRCSHGPGVTAKGLIPNKFEVQLSPGSPVYQRFGLDFWQSQDDGMSRIYRYPVWKHKDYFVHWSTKVALVPKDSRGPRLISCEPLEHMFVQKGIMNFMYDALESHALTSESIFFTSNEVHRNFALLASQNQNWSTLDLKDASDRVSLSLVKSLFAGTTLLDDMLACRTGYTQMDGEIIPLTKWAPMGSALCFPVLAYTCFILVYTCLVQLGIAPEEAKRSILVFGDDIIIRTKYAHLAMSVLEYYGLKINHSKSFINSRFAESCGMDAFDGVEVTPVRLRKLWAIQREITRKKPGEIAYHLVALANLTPLCYVHLRNCLFDLAEMICGGPLPYGLDLSYLCKVCSPQDYPVLMNEYLDRIQPTRRKKANAFLAFRVLSRKTKFSESPYGRLQRILPQMGKERQIEKYGETVLPRDSYLAARKTKLACGRF